MQDPYIPAPDVVEENDRFIFALRNAPNVLYARFKQYGQASRVPHAYPKILLVLTDVVIYSAMLYGLAARCARLVLRVQ